jgi:hypothetical protein
MLAKELCGSPSRIGGTASSPKHEIATGKLQALGMTFGGRPLLVETIRQLLAAQGVMDSRHRGAEDR